MEHGWRRGLATHVRAQAEDGAGATIPIARTNSDLFFGLDNRTGAVVLEEPWTPVRRPVAPSLARFLGELSSTIA